MKQADRLRDSLAGVRAARDAYANFERSVIHRGRGAELFAANERGGGQDFRAVGVLADYAECRKRTKARLSNICGMELE